MNDLFLNTTSWDLEIENGDFKTVDGRNAIGQNIRQRLQTIVGEWFLDLSIYVNYFDNFFEKKENYAIIESELKSVIRNTPGVVDISKFASSFDGESREYSVSFEAETVDGEVKLNEILRG